MDNLTHSFVGAVLGQMGLKRRTGLAMPALIIGANIPDIDGLCMFLGMNTLTARRGLTHGPVAMVLLPLILTGLLLLWAKWRPHPDRPPIHRGWLLALAYIGTLTHPAMDWLNSYGIRLLSPFSDHWFAGDTLFIIDVWIWAALIGGWWLSRRREKAGRDDWRKPAIASFAAVCAYIFANGLITGHAEASTASEVRRAGLYPELVVANPVPVLFWQRDVLWRGGGEYGAATYSIGSDPAFVGLPMKTGMDDAQVALAAARDPAARAFLFWSRMPVARTDGQELVLSDQRFGNPLVSGRFQIRIPLETLK